MRPIDADALKETICNNVYPVADAFNSCDYGMFWTGGIEKAIDEQPTIGEWIPCSERLPKDGQGVLVTVDDNEFDIKVGSCIYSDGVFFSALYDLDVIAWMPLPDPWKGEHE